MGRVRKSLRKIYAEQCEFVGEEVQAKLLDIFWRHPTLLSIKWVKSTESGGRYLNTPFGQLEVRPECGWAAFRNGEPLVHPACRFRFEHERWAAIFTDDEAARAAALMHCIDGWIKGWNIVFNFTDPIDTKFTGLFWWLPHVARSRDGWVATATDARRDVFPSDLEDHFKFLDHDKLRRLVHPWGKLATPDILKSCEKSRAKWPLPMPPFTRRTQGCYELSSPYGNLIVRRNSGWVIEKNSAALCYCTGDATVVCDNLQDAQTLALIFASSRGDDDHLYWREPDAALEPVRSDLAQAAPPKLLTQVSNLPAEWKHRAYIH